MLQLFVAMREFYKGEKFKSARHVVAAATAGEAAAVILAAYPAGLIRVRIASSAVAVHGSEVVWKPLKPQPKYAAEAVNSGPA